MRTGNPSQAFTSLHTTWYSTRTRLRRRQKATFSINRIIHKHKHSAALSLYPTPTHSTSKHQFHQRKSKTTCTSWTFTRCDVTAFLCLRIDSVRLHDSEEKHTQRNKTPSRCLQNNKPNTGRKDEKLFPLSILLDLMRRLQARRINHQITDEKCASSFNYTLSKHIFFFLCHLTSSTLSFSHVVLEGNRK